MFFKSLWLRLPEHVRRGLTRLYLVVSVPWIAWFGYRFFDALQQGDQDLASDAFWFLLVVPIGVPIFAAAVLWVIAGFRETKSSKEDNYSPSMPWGEPSPEAKTQTPSVRNAAEPSAANNYYPLISDAVSRLEDKSEKARQAIYVKARTVLADKLQGYGRPDTKHEWKALEKAIRDVEKDYKPTKAASTISLIASILFLPTLWIMDASSMSLYWIAGQTTRTRKLVVFGFGIVLTLISILIFAGPEAAAVAVALAFSGAVFIATMWVMVRLYWRTESGWQKLRDRGLRNQQLFRQREQMRDRDTNHN